MAMTDTSYPFAGIVGMADLKLALLLNAVSPAIGGVLVRGEKGTAKSTMVRGLATLLPRSPWSPAARIVRSGRARPGLPGGPAPRSGIAGWRCRAAAGHPGRAAGGRDRGPAGGLAWTSSGC